MIFDIKFYISINEKVLTKSLTFVINTYLTQPRSHGHVSPEVSFSSGETYGRGDEVDIIIINNLFNVGKGIHSSIFYKGKKK